MNGFSTEWICPGSSRWMDASTKQCHKKATSSVKKPSALGPMAHRTRNAHWDTLPEQLCTECWEICGALVFYAINLHTNRLIQIRYIVHRLGAFSLHIRCDLHFMRRPGNNACLMRLAGTQQRDRRQMPVVKGDWARTDGRFVYSIVLMIEMSELRLPAINSDINSSAVIKTVTVDEMSPGRDWQATEPIEAMLWYR